MKLTNAKALITRPKLINCEITSDGISVWVNCTEEGCLARFNKYTREYKNLLSYVHEDNAATDHYTNDEKDITIQQAWRAFVFEVAHRFNIQIEMEHTPDYVNSRVDN